MTHECFSAREVLLKAGPTLSYRQLDYWTTARLAQGHGHLGGKVEGELTAARRGSGRPTFWDADEVEVISRAARIIARLQCSASVAFILARTGRVEIEGGGVVVHEP